jgi:hypothetical protein
VNAAACDLGGFSVVQLAGHGARHKGNADQRGAIRCADSKQPASAAPQSAGNVADMVDDIPF